VNEQPKRGGNPAWVKGVSQNPKGKALMAERAAAEEAERQVEAGALAADLGRPATAAERLLIAEAAALAVEARRLRRLGRPSMDATRLLSRVLGQLGLGRPVEQPAVAVPEPDEAIIRPDLFGRREPVIEDPQPGGEVPQ
jgi:hypothetical protein